MTANHPPPPANADCDQTWAPPEIREVTTPDGRALQYCLYGPADGARIVFHNGTPGTCVLSQLAQQKLFGHGGIRVLVYDRPGYGGSTRMRGRAVVDAVHDVRVLVDAEGWERFATYGLSGGAPHALACAARLSDRVSRCASVVGMAPPDASGLDWMAGMTPGNAEEYTLAKQGERAYRPLVERVGREALARIESGQPPIPPEYEMAEADIEQARAHLAEANPGRMLTARRTYVGGFDGWIDDGIALTKPWGFDVAEIGVPLSTWWGREDVLTPRGHTDWLIANLPDAEAHELAGGHGPSDADQAALHEWLSR